MKTYTVEVTRTVSLTKTYTVDASNEMEARFKADELASNEAWDMNGEEATYYSEVVDEES